MTDNGPLLFRSVVKWGIPFTVAGSVFSKDSFGIGLRINADDHLHSREGRIEIVRCIYDALVAHSPSIRYARPIYDPESVQQDVRRPKEILENSGQGTCLDLSLLFCGLCMHYRLLPAVFVFNDHAITGVSTKHTLDLWDNVRRKERRQGSLFRGLWDDKEWVADQISGQEILPVECTGFAQSNSLDSRFPEGRGRNDEGILPFDRAVEAGREQFRVRREQFRFGIDIATAQYYWRIVPEEIVPQEAVRGPTTEGFRNSFGQLPAPGDPDVFQFSGRGARLEQIDNSWKARDKSIVHIVAPGGIGKSTLAWRWQQSFLERGCPDAESGLDWSFYSQGQHVVAGDSRRFVEVAARHFNVELTSDNPDAVGIQLAQAFASQGGVLLLDGLEPMQHLPPDGRLRDDVLRAFIQNLLLELKRSNNEAGKRWMLIITTRWAVTGLGGEGVEKIELERLSQSEGADLLQNFRISGSGPDDEDKRLHAGHESPSLSRLEFEKAANEFGGHALALTLLASYALRHREIAGDIRQRDRIPELLDIYAKDQHYRHAKRVMTCYDQLFAEDGEPISRACRQLLCILGLFNGPAPIAIIKYLITGKPIGWLTEGLSEKTLHLAEDELRRLRLIYVRQQIADADDDSGVVVDTHPLLREHFGKVPEKELVRECHERIFIALGSADETDHDTWVDTLYRRVEHGCKALRYREAFNDVFLSKIISSANVFATRDFGGVGSLLTLLSNFFEENDWTKSFREAVDETQQLSSLDKTALLVHVGEFLATTRAFSDSDVEVTCSRALELCESHEDAALRFRAEAGLLRYWMMRGNVEQGCERADRLYGLAWHDLKDVESTILARRAITTTRFFRGDLKKVKKHAIDAISAGKDNGLLSMSTNQDLHRARVRASKFVGDPFTSCLGYLALCNWHFGNSQEADEASRQAVERTEQLGDPQTLTSTLYLRCKLSYYRQDFDQCLLDSQELAKAAEQTGQQFFSGFGRLISIWAYGKRVASQEGIVEAVQGMSEGIQQWERMDANLMLPFWHTLLADLQNKLEAFDSAARTTETAITLAENLGCLMFLPEMCLQGAIALKASGRREASAESFSRALSYASRCGSTQLISRIADHQ